MNKEKHVHKLRRHTYKTGTSVYFCALPDCNVKIAPALSLGKRCICWRCEQPFIMNDYSIRLAKPHCPNCHKTKDITSQSDVEIISKAVVHEAVSSIEDLRSRLNMATRTEDEDI